MLRCITREQISLYAPNCEEVSTRKLSRTNSLLCPNCLKEVTFNRGSKKGSYFSHRKDADCVVNYYEPETLNHQEGKDILFKWLTKRFKDATVEIEKYIPETQQIADILVTYTSGKAEGKQWAFEFQHSNLTAKEWKERHDLYQSANIHDFWILDEERFLLYSQSKDEYVKKSRRLKDPQEAIFSTTGFCYFLNLTNMELTIDFSFRYEDVAVEKASGGYYPKREYKFHQPHQHSCDLNIVEFMFDEEFNFLAMFYEDVKNEVHQKFKRQIQSLKKEKQNIWQMEALLRGRQKIQYAQDKYGEDFAEYIRTFMNCNKEDIYIDAYNLSEEEFLLKYTNSIKTFQRNDAEISMWKDSPLITHQVFYRLWDIKEKDAIKKMDFLNQQVTTLEKYITEKFSYMIEIINYVLEHYGNVLEVLVSRIPQVIGKRLNEINWRLNPGKNSPTKFDYAFQYHRIESKEEVDELFKKIKEKLNIHNV